MFIFLEIRELYWGLYYFVKNRSNSVLMFCGDSDDSDDADNDNDELPAITATRYHDGGTEHSPSSSLALESIFFS